MCVNVFSLLLNITVIMEGLKTADFPCVFPTISVDEETFCDSMLKQQTGKKLHFCKLLCIYSADMFNVDGYE